MGCDVLSLGYLGVMELVYDSVFLSVFLFCGICCIGRGLAL